MQQQHQLDRGSFSSATSYSPYGGGSIGGINMGAPQRQQQGMGGPQMPTMTRTQQSAPMQGQGQGQGPVGGLSIGGMGMAQDNNGGQAQHFMQQSMSVGGSRTGYGNGQQGQSTIGGSMIGQVNGNGLSQQYQQSMRSSGDVTVGPSMQRSLDGPLQYDSQSFPHLSGGNGGSRFTGLPMQQQMRGDEDFTIQNEDFPALPGSSHGERNSQKHDGGVMGGIGMMSGGVVMGQGSQGIDRMRELSQESLQHQLHEQQMMSQSLGPTVARGSMAQQSIAVGGAVNSNADPVQGGNNSMSNAFLGIGVGGSMQGHMGNGSIGGAMGLSKEGGYGLSGLLDVIRMTDKDLNTLALGSDLTTFGLNLNSSDCLYSSFSSPFSDQPALSEPQYTTPGCYAMHPPSLKPDHLTKFQMETLFYLFYSMPKDLLQACAAQELYRREWRYHGELRLWLKMRNQQELIQGQPNVQFMYFDVSGWEAKLFTSQYRGNIASGLLTEEEVRVKAPLHSQAATAQPGGS